MIDRTSKWQNAFGWLLAIALVSASLIYNVITALTEIISTIPNNVSVTANNWVVSHLVDRDRAYTPPGWYETIWTNPQLSAYSTPPEFDTGTGFPAQDTEYVLTTTATYSNGWDTDIQSMLPKEYNLIAEKDGTELWQLK